MSACMVINFPALSACLLLCAPACAEEAQRELAQGAGTGLPPMPKRRRTADCSPAAPAPLAPLPLAGGPTDFTGFVARHKAASPLQAEVLAGCMTRHKAASPSPSGGEPLGGAGAGALGLPGAYVGVNLVAPVGSVGSALRPRRANSPSPHREMLPPRPRTDSPVPVDVVGVAGMAHTVAAVAVAYAPVAGSSPVAATASGGSGATGCDGCDGGSSSTVLVVDDDRCLDDGYK